MLVTLNASRLTMIVCLAGVIGGALVSPAAAALQHTAPLGIRGPGAAFLLVEEPGDLHVVVRKQDLNKSTRRGEVNLYAHLVGPDRQPLDDGVIRDDGREPGSGPGPVGTLHLNAHVEHPGIYKLLVETTGYDGNDWDCVWGVSTSAERLMLARTDRGPVAIRLLNPGVPSQLYFESTKDVFEIQVTPAHDVAQDVELRDARGEIVDVLNVDGEAPATTRVNAGSHDTDRFGLHIPDQSVAIAIDGVTQWDSGAGWNYEDTTYWAPSADAWFPVRRYRWAIYPHHKRIPVSASGQGEFTLHLRNHGQAADTFDVHIEPESPSGVELLTDFPRSLEIGPGSTKSLSVSYRAASEVYEQPREPVRFFVTPREGNGVTTFGTVEFQAPGATGDAGRALDLPIVLTPYNHENRQFAYYPRYPINEVNFDHDNRPFIRDDRERHIAKGIHTLNDDGRFTLRRFTDALQDAFPEFTRTHLGGGFRPTKTSFCEDNHLYTVVAALGKDRQSANGQLMLLHSRDRGETFEAHRVGERGRSFFDFEHFTGHNTLAGPPPIVAYKRVEDVALQWGYRNRLELYVPRRTSEGIEVDGPIDITDNAINLATHSGGASSIVSRGDKIHVVWGEIVDESDEADVDGVPTYAVTYDRAEGELGQPVLLGYAPPVNDMHNSPGITIDSEGYLHVVFGAHARNPFRYTRSEAPNRVDAGWTEPEKVLETGMRYLGKGTAERGAQTYVGLVCDPDDNLHLAFRQDIENIDGHFENYDRRYRVLSHQKRSAADGQWQERATKLVVPPFPGYSVYYHQLSIDRRGRLFLAYHYRAGHSIYRADLPGAENHPAMLMSDDAGRTWHLVTLGDFLSR